MSDDGGPAFPSHGSMGEVVEDGISLRAYFAAHAPPMHPGWSKHGTASCADWAVEYADALIRRLQTP